jgi:hypothetical protein
MAKKGLVTVVDKGYDNIVAQMKLANGSYTDVGWFVDSKKRTSKSNKYKKGDKLPPTNAEIAFWNEYGKKNVNKTKQRERPFQRPALDKNLSEYKRLRNKLLRHLGLTLDLKECLFIMGQWFQKKVVHEIDNLTEPALAKVTSNRKNSTKPLIDTGNMKQSISHREIIKGVKV